MEDDEQSYEQDQSYSDELVENKILDNHTQEQIIKAKFYIPDENKYKYIHLKIAPSTIPNAGMGVYAVDDIPKGASGLYRGIKRPLRRGNAYYSWIVYEYDMETGETISNKEMFLLDATNKNTSNWTRYVNCGLKKRFNNMSCMQKFDKIYYYAIKNIKPGKELFIDYGKDYRKVNLGMKGTY